MTEPTIDVDIKHFHLFCGLGGGAKGFNRGSARVGSLRARFRCIGGVDNDPAAIRDFTRAAGVDGTVMDLFDEAQYRDFHGEAPPAGWKAATPADMRRAAHGERPNIIFLSAPCKGFSGLLPEKSSTTAKYQALNRLTLRGVWLALEAWKDDPVELFIFENVPRIANRGRYLLDQIGALFRSYGYAMAETTHDCGELGGLGQSRKRFLLVARHEAKVPPYLHEPEKRRLRGVGEILERLPLPGDGRGGPMHRMPALQWKTWVRLAFVEAGSDWRSLNKLAVDDGVLRDFGIMPEAAAGSFSIADPRTNWPATAHQNLLAVTDWGRFGKTITGSRHVSGGALSVADPRFAAGGEYSQYGVRPWDQPSGSVINVKAPGQGTYSVADPRIEGKPRFNNTFRIVPWADNAPAVAGPGGPAGGLAVADPRTGFGPNSHRNKLKVVGYAESAGTVTGADRVGSGALSVADPRPAPRDDYKQTKYRVTGYTEAAGTVISASTTGNGAFAVADPRPIAFGEKREHYQTGGHYGVLPWKATAGAVPAYGKYDRGPWSVADPRDMQTCAETQTDQNACLPAPTDRLVAMIRALDGTWHRPFTTLELAALQSLVDPDDIAGGGFALDGQSDSAWRERIGNAVPPDAAAAIAGVMGTTLLLAMTGETFVLSSQPIWVRDVAIALSVDQRGNIPAESVE